jgi:manganese/zinc/iron transport system permease protein
MTTATFLTLDLAPMLTAAFASASCAVLGSWLLLRRETLLGDAISHSVLPGLVVAFVLTQSREPAAMFVGGATAGIAAALLVELVRRAGRTDSGTAMGVVFSVSFALGVLMLKQVERSTAVDLDADCVLYGDLSRIIWQPPAGHSHLSPEGLLAIPRELKAAAIVLACSVAFSAAFFRKLALISFDPGLARSFGMPVAALSLALTALVAAAVVSSFDAVGSIIVIAMLVAPAASVRMFTDRLRTQLIFSGVVGFGVALAGYLLAGFGPRAVGLSFALSPSGMIASVSGVVLLGAILFSPRHGIVPRRLRWLRVAAEAIREDIIAHLYRLEEGTASQCSQRFVPHAGPFVRWIARRRLRTQGLLTPEGRLSQIGRARGAEIVRSHRLWESYLVQQAGLRADHVHDTAMKLEHLRAPDAGRLVPDSPLPERDPHDKPIPPAP